MFAGGDPEVVSILNQIYDNINKVKYDAICSQRDPNYKPVVVVYIGHNEARAIASLGRGCDAIIDNGDNNMFGATFFRVTKESYKHVVLMK